MNNFEGKTAVVTGGGGGIGESMCRLFAAQGMNAWFLILILLQLKKLQLT